MFEFILDNSWTHDNFYFDGILQIIETGCLVHKLSSYDKQDTDYFTHGNGNVPYFINIGGEYPQLFLNKEYKTVGLEEYNATEGHTIELVSIYSLKFV